jgi:hypothetical protein
MIFWLHIKLESNGYSQPLGKKGAEMSEQMAPEPGKTEALPEPPSDVMEADGSERPARLPEETWKNMYTTLYSYHFGHIDFLTLLDKWEEMLHIKSPTVKPLAFTKPKASK